jgi:hypothetical protein
VRLGLLNSGGTQDLIVHILAPSQRYQVANYPNVTIPTNLDVKEAARGEFGPFYASLFDSTVKANPKAVITEYAWDAETCDPCPGPPLDRKELQLLGADVLHEGQEPNERKGWSREFTLTRLHARYGKESLGEDLVFGKAGPITGGREVMLNGKLEHGSSTTADRNNFQGRYAIRHPWTGAINCKNPYRGSWGGPVGGDAWPEVKPAVDLAFARRDVQLVSFLDQDVPELRIRGLGKGPHDVDTLRRRSMTPASPPAGAGDNRPFVDSKSIAPEGACQCRAVGAPVGAGSGVVGALGLLMLGLARAARARGRSMRPRRHPRAGRSSSPP